VAEPSGAVLTASFLPVEQCMWIPVTTSGSSGSQRNSMPASPMPSSMASSSRTVPKTGSQCPVREQRLYHLPQRRASHRLCTWCGQHQWLHRCGVAGERRRRPRGDRDSVKSEHCRIRQGAQLRHERHGPRDEPGPREGMQSRAGRALGNLKHGSDSPSSWQNRLPESRCYNTPMPSAALGDTEAADEQVAEPSESAQASRPGPP
jgi:hypothetical protein